jgi:Cys-tRNA synthase (O-phospho-L-seryl-tRNA:Cys-tRNA synthase)
MYGRENMSSSTTILKRISKIEEELLKLKIELLPEEIRKILRIFSPHSLILVIPKDEGFREITKDDINKFYKELKNDDFWGTEKELFELLDN